MCAGATIFTAAMHMVVEAVFWFYALVWPVGASDMGTGAGLS
jgi:hypothetical protein